MAAREMVIGKFINQIGFRIDHSTVQQVKNTVESVKSGIKTVQGVADEVKKSVNDNIDEIQKKAQKARSETEKLPEFKPGQKSTQNAKSAIDEIKDYAKKTLGVLGIGFSLAQLRSLAEEFGGINDAIRGATRELGDQSEIQQKILKGAQDCREEYGAMAGSVTKLIQQNGKLFPVDDAVKFVSLVEKLEKGAGREANIDSTMDVLTEAMSSGKLDKTGFANLKSKAPEVVNAISSAVGVSEAQLQKLAESGKLSAKQLKDAFFVSESEIQKNFDELGFDITDALKYVRNEWGLLIADLDDTFGITTRIGKAIRDGSDFLIGKAQKFTSWLKSVSDKLGGVEQLLKLIVLAAAALFLATSGNMVLSFLSGAVKLLKGFNVQTALAAAKWLLLFLVLEDVFTFLQGGDSVLGRFLSDAGVDVDALRDKISNFFSNAKQFGKDALGDLKQFWNEHGDSVLAVLQWLWQGCVDLTADIVTLGGHLFDLLGGLITGFQTGDWTQFLQGCKELWQDFLDLLNDAGRIVFGELWDPLVDSMNGAWNLLKGFFNWFGEKIQWAKNLWSGIKGFFDGNDGDGDGDGDGTTKPNPTPNLKVTTDDGREVPYPEISGTIILMPCGAGGTVGFAFPVKSDDGCLALFNEGGSGTDLKWDLSNAALLPGLYQSPGEQVKKAGSEEAAIMFAPSSTITVTKDKIEIKKDDTKITVASDSIKVEKGGTTVTASSSSVDVTSPSLNIKGNTKVNGDISVTGNVTISGTLTLGGIVMNTHTHVGVHGPTGGPV